MNRLNQDGHIRAQDSAQPPPPLFPWQTRIARLREELHYLRETAPDFAKALEDILVDDREGAPCDVGAEFCRALEELLLLKEGPVCDSALTCVVALAELLPNQAEISRIVHSYVCSRGASSSFDRLVDSTLEMAAGLGAAAGIPSATIHGLFESPRSALATSLMLAMSTGQRTDNSALHSAVSANLTSTDPDVRCAALLAMRQQLVSSLTRDDLRRVASCLSDESQLVRVAALRLFLRRAEVAEQFPMEICIAILDVAAHSLSPLERAVASMALLQSGIRDAEFLRDRLSDSSSIVRGSVMSRLGTNYSIPIPSELYDYIRSVAQQGCYSSDEFEASSARRLVDALIWRDTVHVLNRSRKRPSD